MKIKNRYKLAVIDTDFFKDKNASEIICANFIPSIMIDGTDNTINEEYNAFMDEYDKKHKCCPKCGDTKFNTTLFGYALDHNRKDEYKDLNVCICYKCKDRHIYHDRISEQYFLKINTK